MKIVLRKDGDLENAAQTIVEQLCRERQETVNALATTTGLSQPYLSRISTGKRTGIGPVSYLLGVIVRLGGTVTIEWENQKGRVNGKGRRTKRA